MERRSFLVWAVLLLAAGGLRGQSTMLINPPNPQPGDSVTITLPGVLACDVTLDAAVIPPGKGNATIQLTLGEACDCVSAPLPVTVQTEVGPLSFGTYDVELYLQFRNSEGPCGAPELISTSFLTVSRHGQVVALRPEPARPEPGELVDLAFDMFCPAIFKEPRIETSGSERLIVVDFDPEAPLPPVGCSTEPRWDTRFSLGTLEAGTYRARVRLGNDPAALETEAESVFTVKETHPPLLLRRERFRISADWSAPGHPESSATGVALTEESGYFYFAGASNVELVVKVLNACSVNQRYWVFMAGLTNLNVKVSVQDRFTGRTEVYTNTLGQAFQPVLDTTSFAVCP